MADLKTQQHDGDVTEFLNSVEDPKKREDSFTLMKLMEEATGEGAKMWGPSIVGYGKYHYKYESGREGNWFLAGFSPRKQNISVYIMPGLGNYKKLFDKLGKYRTGKSCLYFKKLDDIDTNVLKELVRLSVDDMRKKYS